NLLHQDEHDGEIRIGMFEVIREFAFERLQQSGELALLQSRLAHHLRNWCEVASDGLVGADQAAWYARLDLEIANIRTALQWANEQRQPESGLAIATLMEHYWEQRGLIAEGLEWLELFLALADAAPAFDSMLLLDSLISAGVLADRRDDYVRSRQLFE